MKVNRRQDDRSSVYVVGEAYLYVHIKYSRAHSRA